MLFRSAIVTLLAAGVSARVFTPRNGFPADSKAGMALLSQATVIQPARRLDNNNGVDYTWIANYDIKYLGCTSLTQISGYNNNNNNNNKNNNNAQNYLYTQQLVRFALCPADACDSCSGGGEYVVNMASFVDGYTEYKMTAAEYACEAVRENCSCNNGDDDGNCEYNCFVDAGMTDCVQYEGGEDFEIQRYLQCRELENKNGNNNNNNNNNNNGNVDGYYYGNLYMGLYCSPNDGKSIYLGLYTDEGCSTKADDSYYGQRMNGATMPYSSTSLVQTECISCLKQNNNGNNNNNNNNNNNGVADLCLQPYMYAAKCEDGMSIDYPDTSACDYIKKTLPRMDAASKSSSSSKASSGGSKGRAGTVFAFMFAATTLLFGAYAYFLYRKIKRGSVSLINSGTNIN